MRTCEVCDKKAMIGGNRKKLRGHFNPQPKHKKFPNLQKFITPEGKHVTACTRCIRTSGKKSLTPVVA